MKKIVMPLLRSAFPTALVLSLAGRATAQAPPRPAPVLEAAPEGTVVFDDDGGRAQIVPRKNTARSELSYHGGPVVAHANLSVIFLGSAWRETTRRALESSVVESLAAFGRSPDFHGLSRYGHESKELPSSGHEDLVDPADTRKISDLEIQARLDRMYQGPSMSAVEAETVHVIFLAPGLISTLGTSSSEKDFFAYHNHYHAPAGVVRYVVVAYDTDRARWLASAKESVTQAIVNPEGSAWY